MKLQVQSYNNGGSAYNAEAEETKFRTYSIEHSFNQPARAVITLADTDGSMMRKYNGDANDVYLGVGKITIEDPDATDIFFGRIMRVVGDGANKTVTLECLDWLEQLNEEQITYDMREDLDGSGLRQSQAHTNPDHAFAAYRAPSYKNLVPEYFFADDDMGWANDVYNGMKLIFTGEMAGNITVGTGPFEKTVTTGGALSTDDDAQHNLWVNDANGDQTKDETDEWTVDYDFRLYVGHNDPTNFYVHDSITAARIKCVYDWWRVSGVPYITLYIEDQTNPGNYLVIDPEIQRGILEEITWTIPGQYLSKLVDANGEARLRFEIFVNTDWVSFEPYYLWLEADVETTAYSGTVGIIDGGLNWLEVGTDLTVAATRIWEGMRYCIGQPIYKHIDSAETPGALITDGDGVVALTCAGTIEHTAGISTRQYKEKTRLEILQDLAQQDKVSFWITLGGSTVTWKKTFGADTQQLTDGGILSWQSLYDYGQMTNEYHVYGARIGDYEIYQSVTNAASVTKYLATRTKTLRHAGLVTDADAKEIGTTLAARDAELSQMVNCTIAGNTATAGHATTIKLGEIVEITSSYLWPNAAKDYIVTRFAYDSKEHKTYLTLHPKVSIGLQEIDSIHTKGAKMETRMSRLEADKYVADLVTHEVS